MRDYIEDQVDEKYYIGEAMLEYFTDKSRPWKRQFSPQTNEAETAFTICAREGNAAESNYLIEPMLIHEGSLKGGKWERMHDLIRRFYNPDGLSPTITCSSGGGHHEPKIIQSARIRKLTPRECWRLMGIDDVDFNEAQRVNSNSQLYKQAGNGIVVDTFVAILHQIYQGRN